MRLKIFLIMALLGLSCQWNRTGNSAGTSPVNSRAAPAPIVSPVLPTTAGPSNRFTDAQFAEHVALLKKKLPSAEFSVIIQPPFVIAGDEPQQVLKQRADNTVKWAVDQLKQNFFAEDPKEILDIWLFKDSASYEKHALLLFGESPTTPYGYYSSSQKALVMNIGTGGGTLVHEIVHPFIEANFPECPPWLNEGLGSLYEQSGEVSGRIHGFTNWRLPGLQRAIKAKEVRSFKTLTAMSSRAFYNDDRGVNYAQARYLCYYLQEKGLLIDFYREFRAHHRVDPGGYLSLQKVLGERRMDLFQSCWENFVLELRYDR